MSKNALKIILLWLAAEAFIWIPYRNFISYDKVLVAVVYFLIYSSITIFLFKDVFKKLITDTKANKYLLIVGSLIFHGLVYWFCNTYLSAPLELMKNSPASYTLVNNYFLFGKPFDILLQQLMLVVLVKKLEEENISLKNIALVVTVIFGIAHLEALRRMELVYALILTSAATLMALIIPRLILKIKDGFIHSFMIHLAFVDVAALLFWIIF
ncbi:MAG: hypothetical protein COY80_05355 [Candidatus Pacebacteria bacterium CG_4_10_14_0_8_um_filter_42_14]|nr:MAG: hypothetical protein COY80_05355 [Candidatus Pacebacteria bacterium CG_4_10_14_0_8_um_filter_42_14]